jgi:hypothetical protein
MKRLILILTIAAAIIVPSSAQVRIDLGLWKPFALGFTDPPVDGSDLKKANDIIASQIWLMIPEIGAYYEFNLEPLPLRLGIGARVFSVILATMGYPNAYAELELGPLEIEAQIGGLAFGYYVFNTVGGDFGNVFIPDLSAWLALGKKKSFRIGGGATMLYAPDAVDELDASTGTSIIPFFYYASAKFVIRP